MYFVKKIIRVLDYDPTLTYYQNQEVSHEGLWFKCLRETPPGIDIRNTYYWQAFSELGPPGGSGTMGTQGKAGHRGVQGPAAPAASLFPDISLDAKNGTIDYNDQLAVYPNLLPTAAIDPVTGELKH